MVAEKLYYSIDLEKDAIVQSLKTPFMQGDENAHVLTFNVYDRGNAADLSGATCTGGVVRSDNSVVGLTGTISGNTVSVVIPPAAYNISGRISMIVKLSTATEIRTVLMIAAIVADGATGPVVESTTTIEEVAKVLAEAQRVLDQIPENYSQLSANVTKLMGMFTVDQNGDVVVHF